MVPAAAEEGSTPYLAGKARPLGQGLDYTAKKNRVGKPHQI